ncbi:hypothetical protein BD311DRAFT_605891, partial [Dichomitus squalens]
GGRSGRPRELSVDAPSGRRRPVTSEETRPGLGQFVRLVNARRCTCRCRCRPLASAVEWRAWASPSGRSKAHIFSRCPVTRPRTTSRVPPARPSTVSFRRARGKVADLGCWQRRRARGARSSDCIVRG